ncbi:MAG: hypothetical protein GTN80_00325 [Nitrososphaeria archaeon]|nr:hypothetical protein [Nitrososphaeria archaeon]NIN51606.1 hypothetical protein [Nitrososphaeria archaeon]NIQ32091.1 hypothetical protein [Nitrososphaeria archaeon]
MRLLVSVVDREEALQALAGGADIIDVKNPQEGSLGANFPWVIREVKEAVHGRAEVSATLGDLPNTPGTATLAALGATLSGADYVKVGLFGTRTIGEALFMMKNVCRAVREQRFDVKVIASGYADHERISSISPLRLPEVAQKSGADGVLVDTKLKRDEKLFDLLTPTQLSSFAKESHRYGLTVAFAGMLDIGDIPEAHRLGADIIGTRRYVCEQGDRIRGRVNKDLVRAMAEITRKL